MAGCPKGSMMLVVKSSGSYQYQDEKLESGYHHTTLTTSTASRQRRCSRGQSWTAFVGMTAFIMTLSFRANSAWLSAPAALFHRESRLLRQQHLLGWDLSRHSGKIRVQWQSEVALKADTGKPFRTLSIDEAMGKRPPPSLDSYEDSDAYGSYETAPTVEQPVRPFPPIQQKRPVPSPRPNYGAIPDFYDGSNSFVSEDGDINDYGTDGALVEEQMVSDVLHYLPPSQLINQVTPLRSAVRHQQQVYSADYVSEEDLLSLQAPTNKPAYLAPTLEELVSTTETVMALITEENNGKALNINSPRQVATALFGSAGGSTRKDVLEALAGAGNRMADLILRYREAKYKLDKLQRRRESVAKGTAVKSAVTVKRVYNETASEDDDQRDPLILVDASAYIFRAYYSMPPIHRSDGMPTGAVMGFCKMLNSMLLDSMIEGQQPRLVLCFDAKGKTFRHDMFPDYKGNRPAAPMDLIPQFDFVRKAAEAYGIAQIEAFGYEADDVIATLATRAIHEGVDANIISGDKDLMQLVTDFGVSPSIQIIDPMKRDRTTYTEVFDKWEVGPRQLGDVLALAGDTADNIPGIKGIGAKTAAKLINEYGSLENLLENIDKIKQKGLREKLSNGQTQAKLSRKLVELCRDVSVERLVGFPAKQRVGELRMEPLDPDRVLSFYDSMGFRELQNTLRAKLTGKKVQRKPVTRRPKAEVPRPEDYVDVPF